MYVTEQHFRGNNNNTEVEALGLAMSWLLERGTVGQSCLVCSDSLSALTALDSCLASKGPLGPVIQQLRQVRCSVSFQWVPGHCGLMGNETADRAAREAAADPDGRPMPVSFAAAKSLVKRAIIDPRAAHPLVGLVYSGGRIPTLSDRVAQTTVARLRSGHSTLLAAYRARIGTGDSPLCPRCGEEDEDVVQWLCHCPASSALRMRCFGTVSPSLAVLAEDVEAVASYLGGLGLL